MFAFLWRQALRRGLLGTSRTWFAVFAGLAAVRVIRRLSGGEPKVVFSERLPAGGTLVISSVSPDREPVVVGGA